MVYVQKALKQQYYLSTSLSILNYMLLFIKYMLFFLMAVLPSEKEVDALFLFLSLRVPIRGEFTYLFCTWSCDIVEKRKISYFVLARNLIQHWISPNQDDLSYSARTFISG